MVEVVAALAASETVRINVLDAAHERRVERLMRARAPKEAVRYHRIATDDAWIRDYGAIFVGPREAGAPLQALDFDYNAWGGKYLPYEQDAAVAAKMAAALALPCRRPGIVLEGGSIDVNGAGALLTTAQCLLNQNRNPELSREQIEALLHETLGAEHVVWLGNGLVGDDTDGHVDDISRFVGPSTVVTAVVDDIEDANYAALASNKRRLEDVVLDGIGRLEVVNLPMPPPLYANGVRLPASYANFYIANEIVLVPTFSCPQDDPACGILRSCFPNRRVLGIDCRALVVGLGALHCLTQQVPLSPA